MDLPVSQEKSNQVTAQTMLTLWVATLNSSAGFQKQSAMEHYGKLKLREDCISP